jgi:peptidoglycan LD-endopeptidase CwlK
MDARSEERIKLLYPDLAVRARRVFIDVERLLGVKLRVTETLRSFEKQAALYAKGRTEPGPIVTNARPGYSFHAYGLAFDTCFDGADPYLEKFGRDVAKLHWSEFGRIAEAHGLVWGGNFKAIPDRPHCQLTYGLSINECTELYRQGGVPAVWKWIDGHVGYDSSTYWPDFKSVGP